MLESLEAYRSQLEEIFPRAPAAVTVVLHDSQLQLTLAQPALALARLMTAPAGRRYMTGWATTTDVHTLAPQVLRRVAGGEDSLKALMLSPERAYTKLVLGANSSLLAPPLRPSTLAATARFAWLAEGASQFFSGQVPHLRAALARRLRGRPPQLPPSMRDAVLLGGSIFDLLERARGFDACVRLALLERPAGGRQVIEDAFDAPLSEVRLHWRSHIEELARALPKPGRF